MQVLSLLCNWYANHVRRVHAPSVHCRVHFYSLWRPLLTTAEFAGDLLLYWRSANNYASVFSQYCVHLIWRSSCAGLYHPSSQADSWSSRYCIRTMLCFNTPTVQRIKDGHQTKICSTTVASAQTLIYVVFNWTILF